MPLTQMENNSWLRILYLTDEENCPGTRLVSDCLNKMLFHVEVMLHEQVLNVEPDYSQYALVLLFGGNDPEQIMDAVQGIRKTQRHFPLLLLVNGGTEAAAANCLNKGADQFLVIDEENAFIHLLPAVVRNLLSRFRLEQEKHDMLATLQYRNRALASLNQLGNELNSTLDSQMIMNRLMGSGIDVIGAEGSSLWLWADENEETLVCRAVIHRVTSPPLEGIKLEKGAGIVGWAALHNQSLILNDPQLDTRFAKEIDYQINFNTNSLLAVPLKIHDRVTGVIEFVNKIEGQFENDDLMLAETLAAYVVTALENARLVDSLKKSTLELQERNAELNAFGYTVAHDIQNMISRVAGFSQYLLDEVERSQGPILPEKIQHPAQIIVRDSTKMSKVIDALMLLGAVRDAEVTFELVDVGLMFDEAVQRLTDQLEESGGEIKRIGEWPLAFGYAPWIEEVWFNYIGNGLKYGGIPPILQVGADRIDSDCVRFWVKDCGQGISEEKKKLIFRPFTDYAHRKQSGHGLGLSIVHRIVSKMNGVVGVDSVPGEGSCFYFVLPAGKSP